MTCHRVLVKDVPWHGREPSVMEETDDEEDDDDEEELQLRQKALDGLAAVRPRPGQEVREGVVEVEKEKLTVAKKRRLRKKRVAEKWRRKAEEDAAANDGH